MGADGVFASPFGSEEEKTQKTGGHVRKRENSWEESGSEQLWVHADLT